MKHVVETLNLRAIPRLPWRQRIVQKQRVEMAFSKNIQPTVQETGNGKAPFSKHTSCFLVHHLT